MSNKLLKKYTEAQEVFGVLFVIIGILGIIMLFCLAEVYEEKNNVIIGRCKSFLNNVQHTGVIKKNEANDLITFLNNNDKQVYIKIQTKNNSTVNKYNSLDSDIQLQYTDMIMLESETSPDFYGSAMVLAYHPKK